MVKKQASLAEKLDDIADRAPRLRAAGVLHVEADGVAFDLAPATPAAPRATGGPAPNESQPPPEIELGNLRDAFPDSVPS